VCGNEEADRLAGSAPVKGKLQDDKNDVIKTLWDTVWSDSDKMENVYVGRMKLFVMARDFARHSLLTGKSGGLSKKCITGLISMRTLRWLLNWETERL
jgi:hypothetical protein